MIYRIGRQACHAESAKKRVVNQIRLTRRTGKAPPDRVRSRQTVRVKQLVLSPSILTAAPIMRANPICTTSIVKSAE